MDFLEYREKCLVSVPDELYKGFRHVASPSCLNESIQIPGIQRAEDFYKKLQRVYSRFPYFLKYGEIIVQDGMITGSPIKIIDLSDFNKKLDVHWRVDDIVGLLTNISRKDLDIFVANLRVSSKDSTDVSVRILPQSLKIASKSTS